MKIRRRQTHVSHERRRGRVGLNSAIGWLARASRATVTIHKMASAGALPGDRHQVRSRTIHPSMSAAGSLRKLIMTDQPLPANVVSAATGMGLGDLVSAFPVRDKSRVLLTIYVFQQGCVFVQSDAVLGSFRWSDVTMLIQSRVQEIRQNVPTYMRHQYLFVCADGSQYRADGKSYNFGEKCGLEDFGRVVNPLVTAVQLPVMRAALARGEPVTFGPLAIEPEGIRKDRKKLLPWSEFEQLKITDGSGFIVPVGDIEVRRRGKRLAWFKWPMSKMPNVAALLVLSQEASGG